MAIKILGQWATSALTAAARKTVKMTPRIRKIDSNI
jgi:hypothetical protein